MKETKLSPILEHDEKHVSDDIAAQTILFRRKLWSSQPFGRRLIKRSIDLLGSIVLLIALSPLMLVIALLIKATDGGPVIFWQDRVGKWGHVFRFPKFRSMIENAEALQESLERFNEHGEGSITFKIKNDPRLTWIGRIIRRGSIDELPQLWNVLKGEMSLVGPRPPLPREVAQYSLNDRRRLDVLPGLTCIWQVQGRSSIPFAEQVELDVDYIESQSTAEDVKLLAKTLPAVIKGKGAS
jgi:lipopolysaccharide/colanic/teichoic acid biosynthesis glycosyltransferase